MSSVAKVRQSLAAQHPIHDMFGEVFEELGGKEFLVDWARDNPGRFISIFTKMTPGLQPQAVHQGDVILHVHPALAPTELDVIDSQ